MFPDCAVAGEDGVSQEGVEDCSAGLFIVSWEIRWEVMEGCMDLRVLFQNPAFLTGQSSGLLVGTWTIPND